MKHIDREMALIIMVFSIGIIAAIQKEWATAGACVTGAFGILKLNGPNEPAGADPAQKGE